MARARNIKVKDKYGIGQPYKLRSVTKELHMSCDGYHFDHWNDENNIEYQDEQTCIFNIKNKYLSAQWFKGCCWATFYNDIYGENILSVISAHYGEVVNEPENPPQPETDDQYFSEWSYTGPRKLICDVSAYPVFRGYYHRTYKYRDEEQYRLKERHKYGEKIKYEDSSKFKREYHTIYQSQPYTLVPDIDFSHNGISSDQYVYINDVPNNIEDTIIDRAKYDGLPHCVQVTLTLDPDSETPLTILYREEGEENWKTTPTSHVEKGIYPVEVSGYAEDYYPYYRKIDFIITDKDIYTVYFKYRTYDVIERKRNDNNIKTVYVEDGSDAVVPPEVSADTADSTWKGFDIENGWKKITKNTYLISLYDDVYNTVRFNLFDIQTSSYQEYIEKSVIYGGETGCDNTIVTEDWINKGGWYDEDTGFERTSSQPSLAYVISSFYVYEWVLRNFKINIYNVYNGRIYKDRTLRREDHSMLGSIEPTEIENWYFDRWYPYEEIENIQVLSDMDISAIYIKGRGVLTYHSNFPNATEQLEHTQLYNLGECFNLCSISSDIGWSCDYHNFIGWSWEKDGSVKYDQDRQTVMFEDEETHLYAQWLRTGYKFTYNDNLYDPTPSEYSTAATPQNYQILSEQELKEKTTQGFRKTGYYISAWNDPYIGIIDTDYRYSELYCDTTISALWSIINNLKVTFLDIDANIIQLCSNVNYGQQVIPPEAPEIKNYVFIGWSNESRLQSVVEDLTCQAIYNRKPSVIYRRGGPAITYDTVALCVIEYSPNTIVYLNLDTQEYPIKRPYHYVDEEWYSIAMFTKDMAGEYNDYKLLTVYLSTQDETVYTREVSQYFEPTINTQYKYNGEPHKIEVLSIGSTVQEWGKPDIYSIDFSYDGNTWFEESPDITDPSCLQVIVRISADDFITFQRKYDFIVGDGFYVKFHYFTGDETAAEETKIAILGSNLCGYRPENPDTIASVFMGWDKPEELSYISNDIETNGIYEIRKLSVFFFWDQYETPPYKLHEDLTRANSDIPYGDEIQLIYPLTRNGWRWNYWCDSNGNKIQFQSREGEKALRITKNISAYANFSKYVDLSIEQIYEDGTIMLKYNSGSRMLSGDVVMKSSIISFLADNPIIDYTLTSIYPDEENYTINEDTIISAYYETDYYLLATTENEYITTVENGNKIIVGKKSSS